MWLFVTICPYALLCVAIYYHLLLVVTTCCYLLLFVMIYYYFHYLMFFVAVCFYLLQHLLLAVASCCFCCYLLPFVTMYCYLILSVWAHTYSHCHYSLRLVYYSCLVVAVCNCLFVSATVCYDLLLFVDILRYSLLHVTICCHLL